MNNNEFSELYKNTFKVIFRFFYYKGLKVDISEELSAETYFRLYKSGNFSKAYLHGIASNVYKEYIRNEIKVGGYEGFDEEYYIVNEDDLNSDEFSDKLDSYRDKLKQLIETLNENVKKVIKMRFLDGKKITDVAEELNMSVATVKKYQSRGIKYLKDKLVSESNNVNLGVYLLSLIL